jgi:hypothetical protein
MLLWRRVLRAGHPWGVVVMLMTGRQVIRSALVGVRFPVVDVWVMVLCLTDGGQGWVGMWSRRVDGKWIRLSPRSPGI